jgi:hypothetical protein
VLRNANDLGPDEYWTGTAGTTGAPLHAAVIFLGDQLPIPTQDRVRRDDAAELAQRLSPERFSRRREPAALVVGEADPLCGELLAKDAVFLLQIVDDVALLAIGPACEQKQQESKRLCAHEWQRSVANGDTLSAKLVRLPRCNSFTS